MAYGHVTRRKLLTGSAVAGLAGLGAAGVTGYEWSSSRARAEGQGSAYPSAQPTSAQVAKASDAHAYLSRSDLQPPRLSVAEFGSSAGLPPYMFLGNKPFSGARGAGQDGLMITQRDGEIVWFSPISSGSVWDLNVQSYKGKPVLTWWHGNDGKSHGEGTCYIADSTYSLIATVQTKDGVKVDGHEFNLTSQGTALVDAYREHKADLRSVGGKANGYLESGVVQEIDIATGDVVFEWDSADHVPATESYVKFSGGTAKDPYSYFHINSVAVAPDGDLLVSARHTWTVYKIGRHDGKIRWRLGGKKSDFTFDPGARFYWQHHVRAHGENLLTVFDNGAGVGAPAEAQSRGLLLSLDTERMHVTLVRAFISPGRLLAGSQGSIQLLPGNRAFVGWGSQPYFTEFDADGSILLNGYFPLGNQSYRAFLGDWTGHPKDRPAVTAKANPAGGTAVYVSWNGATEVAAWRVQAGKHESSLDTVGTQPSSGFETLITVTETGPYFAVTAHDSSGNMIGQSATVRKT